MNDATRLRIIVALATEVSAFTFTALMLVHGYAIGASAIAACLSGLISALTTRWTLKLAGPAAPSADLEAEMKTEVVTEVDAEGRQWSRIRPVRVLRPAARTDYDRARQLR